MVENALKKQEQVQSAIKQANDEAAEKAKSTDELDRVIEPAEVGGVKPAPLSFARRLLINKVLANLPEDKLIPNPDYDPVEAKKCKDAKTKYEEEMTKLADEDSMALVIYTLFGPDLPQLRQLANDAVKYLDKAWEFADRKDPAKYIEWTVYAQKKLDHLGQVQDMSESMGGGGAVGNTIGGPEKNVQS